MMRLEAALIVSLLLAPLPAAALSQGPADRARQWLNLVDDGNYREVAGQLAPQAKKSEATELTAMRKPLGAMASRDLRAIELTPVAPGLPRGDYAVVRYESHFAHKTGATETVTLIMIKGGWEVLDYQVT
jgi:hypothetical protein